MADGAHAGWVRAAIISARSYIGAVWLILLSVATVVVCFLVLPPLTRWLIRKGYATESPAQPKTTFWDGLRTQQVWYVMLQVLMGMIILLSYLNII